MGNGEHLGWGKGAREKGEEKKKKERRRAQRKKEGGATASQ